jgi:hypothetical protein
MLHFGGREQTLPDLERLPGFKGGDRADSDPFTAGASRVREMARRGAAGGAVRRLSGCRQHTLRRAES